jgi:hypothetical protein
MSKAGLFQKLELKLLQSHVTPLIVCTVKILAGVPRLVVVSSRHATRLWLATF